MGAQAVIPPRSNRLTPRQFDRGLYPARNLVERFFARLKHFRRQTHRHTLRQTRQVVPLLHSSCMRLRLVGLIENSP